MDVVKRRVSCTLAVEERHGPLDGARDAADKEVDDEVGPVGDAVEREVLVRDLVNIDALEKVVERLLARQRVVIGDEGAPHAVAGILHVEVDRVHVGRLPLVDAVLDLAGVVRVYLLARRVDEAVEAVGHRQAALRAHHIHQVRVAVDLARVEAVRERKHLARHDVGVRLLGLDERLEVAIVRRHVLLERVARLGHRHGAWLFGRRRYIPLVRIGRKAVDDPRHVLETRLEAGGLAHVRASEKEDVKGQEQVAVVGLDEDALTVEQRVVKLGGSVADQPHVEAVAYHVCLAIANKEHGVLSIRLVCNGVVAGDVVDKLLDAGRHRLHDGQVLLDRCVELSAWVGARRTLLGLAVCELVHPAEDLALDGVGDGRVGALDKLDELGDVLGHERVEGGRLGCALERDVDLELVAAPLLVNLEKRLALLDARQVDAHGGIGAVVQDKREAVLVAEHDVVLVLGADVEEHGRVGVSQRLFLAHAEQEVVVLDRDALVERLDLVHAGEVAGVGPALLAAALRERVGEQADDDVGLRLAVFHVGRRKHVVDVVGAGHGDAIHAQVLSVAIGHVHLGCLDELVARGRPEVAEVHDEVLVHTHVDGGEARLELHPRAGARRELVQLGREALFELVESSHP